MMIPIVDAGSGKDPTLRTEVPPSSLAQSLTRAVVIAVWLRDEVRECHEQACQGHQDSPTADHTGPVDAAAKVTHEQDQGYAPYLQRDEVTITAWQSTSSLWLPPVSPSVHWTGWFESEPSGYMWDGVSEPGMTADACHLSTPESK